MLNAKSWTSLNPLIEHNIVAPDASLQTVAAHFQIRVSPVMQTLLVNQSKEALSRDPIYLQFIPQQAEQTVLTDEVSDPIFDAAYTPVTGIVHRYADRALLKITQLCAVYCRFCFRKEMVGNNGVNLQAAELAEALAYIRAHTELWEIILTGGDPLILANQRLQSVLEALKSIAHIGVVRIHTRIPVVAPERIDASLLELLRSVADSGKCVYMAIHANHADEFTEGALKALADLRSAGVILVSQSVLLQGVNDSAKALTDLMRLFVRNGVKPYYLHQLDFARGTSHFRVPEVRALELMHHLRQTLSGLCIPTLIQEIPGGKKPLY